MSQHANAIKRKVDMCAHLGAVLRLANNCGDVRFILAARQVWWTTRRPLCWLVGGGGARGRARARLVRVRADAVDLASRDLIAYYLPRLATAYLLS